MILTAAHCLEAYDFLVYVNIDNFNDISLETPYYVKDILRYPKYDGETSFDIGLVVLEQHIKLSHSVQLINIASTSPRIGSKVTVAGFGYDICNNNVWSRKYWQFICKGSGSNILRSAVLTVIKNRNGILYTRGKNQNTCYVGSTFEVFFCNRENLLGFISSFSG